MPKIGTRLVKGTNLKVEVILYYIPKADYGEPEFAVVPVKSEYIKEFVEGITSITLAKGKHTKGTKGKTEDEAIQNFKEYLIKLEAQTIKKEAVILIKIDQTGGENHFHRKDTKSSWSVKQTGCRISFEYKFCYRIETDGVFKYYSDGIYSEVGKDQPIYEPKKYAIVAGTSENLLKCEQIIESMNKITDMLTELFKDSETAQKALQTSIGLLLAH